MFCRDCGASISTDSKFCKECGSKLGANVRTTVLTAEDLEPVVGEVNQERLTKLLDMAFWHNDVGNIDSAILASEAALTINPSSTTAHSLLATLYEKKGSDDRALEHLDAVLALNPESTADIAKRDQLKRGVHVKAIQPPIAYRWLPPALTSLSLSGIQSRIGVLPGMKPVNPRLAPILYSGLAVAVVIGFGLAAVKPQARPMGNAVRPSLRTVPTQPTVATNTDNVPQTIPQPAAADPPPPVRVASNGRAKNTDDGDLLHTPDPFAESLVSQAGTEPLFPSAPRAPRNGSGLHSLPDLKAVPISPGSISPAPVNIGSAPLGAAPLVTADNIPRHTVVVSQLGGQQPTGDGRPRMPIYPVQTEPSQPTVSNDGNDGGAGDSVIHVTVHDTPKAQNGNENTDLNRGESSVSPAPVRGDEAQAYQQYALSLQEQGDFRGAKTAYERAIRTYKARMRSGHDTDDARRGLKACTTGLEICQQSLQ